MFCKIMINKNIIYAFLYFLLIVVGIPWYWNEDFLLIFIGIPVWVIVAILCSVLASILTAYILVFSIGKNKNE